MKKIYSILLILTLLIFTGCSSNYEIVEKGNDTINKTIIGNQTSEKEIIEKEIIIEEKNPQENIDTTIKEKVEIKKPTPQKTTFYKKEYIYDSKSYNIQLRTEEEILKNKEITLEVDMADIVDSESITMLFQKMDGYASTQVTIGSSFLTSFLSGIHDTKFADFREETQDKFNCDKSTLENKYILFMPYSNREGVFYDKTNGCITFETSDSSRTIILTEKLAYALLE